ncbi:hypothetical protein GYMLUDRAFT_248434 [Collybiopsis luxurians FD-317 M1]|uniref:Unplaced genomic scaffold GYMLUscaffold_55, whole genome shotgun sequence n=1 Tax=Collybiopsis luxurians FD-317 M1 TaxID=944289 RepID=A0A0D0CCP9_9AGAR|nr:hypothetical protein GYMLUDRAFT_248434 [Collybiopsis luxurians FD-317 M1]
MLSAALFISTLILTVVLLRRHKRPAPPGPKGWPIIGNILDIPAKDPWKVFQKWSENIGSDVLLIRLPGVWILYLNTTRSVQDLLVKRSAIYSDRPKSTMLELMGLTWVFGLMPYGSTWKEHRRTFMREFNTEIVRPHALQSARRLLPRLLNSDINYRKQIQLSSADAILSATFGISPKSEEDHFVCLAESMIRALTEAFHSPYLVDIFPIIKHIPVWFPGAKFKRKTSEWRILSDNVQTEAYEYVKSKMDAGTAVPCVATNLITSLRNDSLSCSESTMRSILAEAYLGGAGATVGTLCSFMLTMGLFPEIQAKAYASIIAVVGPHRLPDFSDFGKIPYLDAVLNEIFRWNPLAPFGVFHSVTQDDYYDGYLIPKGTFICGNAWAVMHDASIYGPSPDDFNPERFLLPDGTRNMAIPDADGAFGFGRRRCPGRAIGRDVVWIAIASILTTYKIGEPIGKDGKCLDPAKIQYTNSMNR